MNETSSITILAMPKPFVGHFKTIQRNAIESWTKLSPRPEIFLFGYEEGVKECAADLGLVHIPDVERNRYGTPLLADIFARGEAQTKNDVLAYVNADIILPRQFSAGMNAVRHKFPEFLGVGRRTNLDVREPIEFTKDWEKNLMERVTREGRLDTHTGIDFFAFTRGLYKEVPPLAIGRVWFDQWCIKYVRERGLPVIDMTGYVPIVHQIHDYSHVAGGKQWSYGGPEADENLVSYGAQPHAYTILSATHTMTPDGRIRRAILRKEMLAVKTFLWEMFIHRTKSLRQRIGLSKSSSN